MARVCKTVIFQICPIISSIYYDLRLWIGAHFPMAILDAESDIAIEEYQGER